VKAAKVLGIGRTYLSELENAREPGKHLAAKFEAVERASSAELKAVQSDRRPAEFFPNPCRFGPWRPGIPKASRRIRFSRLAWARADSTFPNHLVASHKLLCLFTLEPRGLSKAFALAPALELRF
jgi:hypothetical protein